MTAAGVETRRSTTGRYRLLDRIAGGAHGEVWRARADNGTVVAVKLLGGPGVTKEARLRFFQEQAFRFDHPNVVGPRGITEFDGTHALVMDLVDGADLRAVALANGGTLADDVLWAVAADALLGLAYLHGLGIVHRDVSPGNLLIARSGDRLVTRIGDFGTALDLEGGRLSTMPGMIVGTHGFAAPELYSGVDADERSDLWSLGATLRSVRGDAQCDTLSALLDALCATDPADRPRSADAAIALLADDTPTVPSVVVPRLPPMRRRHRAVVAALCVLTLIAGGLAVALRTPTKPRPTTWQRVIDSTIRTGYDSSVARAHDGRLLVAHTDFTAGHLLLTVCDDDACAHPRTRVLDPATRSGYYPSLEIDENDRPVIAYQDSGRSRLLVRRCADTQCSTSAVDAVPIPGALQRMVRQYFTTNNPGSGSGEIALRPQIALDGSRIVVAFDDAQTNHVVLAERSCTQGACAWRTHDLGAGGGGSLALLADGRPVVAGTSRIAVPNAIPALTGLLWFAVCADPACTHHTRVETDVLAQAPTLAATPHGVVAATSIYETSIGPSAVTITSLRLDGCGDTPCSTPSHRLIAVGEQAESPDLTVGRHGVVVAYKVSNAAAPGLAYAVCPDFTCEHTPREYFANTSATQSVASSGHDPSVVTVGDDVWISHSMLPPSTGSAGRLVMFHTILR